MNTIKSPFTTSLHDGSRIVVSPVAQKGIGSVFSVQGHPLITHILIPSSRNRRAKLVARVGAKSYAKADWRGCVSDAIESLTFVVNGYRIRFNSLFSEYRVSHPIIGAVGEYQSLNEAVVDCLKG